MQDAVPRVGKFIVLFSRPGQRVIVDYRGDVVVRPSPHEIHLRSGAAFPHDGMLVPGLLKNNLEHQLCTHAQAATPGTTSWPATGGPLSTYAGRSLATGACR